MSPLDYASSRHGVFELVFNNRKVVFLVKNSKIPKFEDPWTFFSEKRGMTLNIANAIEG